MAIIPLFRVTIFTLITLFSLVVLGICAHIEYLIAGYTEFYTSFAPFGIGAACLTVVSLSLFFLLGNLRQRVFTSMIVFELVWFFILWVLWAGTAGDTVAGKSYHFPSGCIYDSYPTANQICHEFAVVEAFSFLNFFCAFIYYDVIVLYAIINAIRGRGVWTSSVKEAATGTGDTVKSGAPMQPQFNAPPVAQYQNYDAFPPNAPPTQPPYIAYPQQVPPQGPPPAQSYNGYPNQVPPEGPPPQQYNAYSQQAPYGHPSTVPPSQSQPYRYPPSPSVPQQQVNYVGYSPSPPTNNAPLPPHPNYTSYPVSDSHGQLPLPSGYV